MAMPASKKCIDLHLAKSFDELNKKAELSVKFTNIERVIQSTERLWLGSKEEEMNGDEEKLYMFLYRIVAIYLALEKKDHKLYHSRCGDKITQAMKKLEALSERLRQRYQEKTRVYEERRVEVLGPDATQKSKPVPGLSVKVKSEATPENWYEETTPTQLHDTIKSLPRSGNLLLLDIREAEDFNFSSIAANKLKVPGSLTIVNIPGSKIKPSLTCAQLMKNLALGMGLDALERRRIFNHVVILDDNTFHFEKTCKSVILADALWKWDQSPDRIKAKPMLMHGGFYQFVLTYPMLTTNATALSKYSSQPIPVVNDKTKLEKMRYNFDVNGQTINEPEVDEEMPMVNDMDDDVDESPMDTTSPTIDLAEANKPLGRLYDFGPLSEISQSNKNSVNNLYKVPGVARPVIPDRASKPSISFDSQHDVKLGSIGSRITNYDAHKMVNGNMKMMEIADDGEESDYDLGAGKFDDDLKPDEDEKEVGMKNIVTPPRNGFVNRVTLENGSDGEEEEEEDEEEERFMANGFTRSLSKPIDVTPSSNYRFGKARERGSSLPQSSLSRSLSSPNIAQLGLEAEIGPSRVGVAASASSHSYGTAKQAQPLIDRSVKPTDRSLALILHKARDFSPQWGTTSRVAGLRNLGNTCFMNAVLQCLNNTWELSNYMKETNNIHLNKHSKFGTGGELAIELGMLFKQMSQSNYKNLSPRDLKNAVSKHIPDFIDYKQQDAHEFLVRLLDRLHADMNVKPENQIEEPTHKDPNYYDNMACSTAANTFWKIHRLQHRSIILQLFEGLIVATLRCEQCSYTSKSLEPFTCLSVPVQQGARTSLKSSLANLFKRERISDETAWQCPTCKQKRDAEKSTILWKLPKILLIHLKRFTYEGLWRTKITSYVDFPIENLSLIEANGQTRSYNLYGVVNHTGSLEGGHYTAFSRNPETNLGWHKFDDSDVTPLSPADIITQNAYVLFYHLVN